MDIRPLVTDRRTVAYHEAGHAVMAHLSGQYEIDGPISLDGTGTEDGNAVTPLVQSPELTDRRRAEGWVVDGFEQIKQRVVVAASGYAAEVMLAAKDGKPMDEQRAFLGAHGDVKDVQELWGKGSFFPFVEKVLTEMMRPEVWAMVDQLAKALLAHDGPMSSAQVTNELVASQHKGGLEFSLHLPELSLPPAAS